MQHDDGLIGPVITDSDSGSDSMWCGDESLSKNSVESISSSTLVAGVIGNSEELESDRFRLKSESDEKIELGDGGVSVGVASVLTLLIVIDVSEPSEGVWHLLPRGKSRSKLRVRNNCLCRLLSECGCVVLVVMVRFLDFIFNVRDSSETSCITGRDLRRKVSNKGDFGGISDDGEGSGC